MRPGEILFAEQPIVINRDRPVIRLRVHNSSSHTIQVSSHFHLFEVNERLEFDREKSFGLHLDLPAGRSVRFGPGEEKEVSLVPYAGRRTVHGFRGLGNAMKVEEAGDATRA